MQFLHMICIEHRISFEKNYFFFFFGNGILEFELCVNTVVEKGVMIFFFIIVDQ